MAMVVDHALLQHYRDRDPQPARWEGVVTATERQASLISKTAIATAALLAFGALLAGPAFATHVTCGQVITKSTTLDSDLTNCPGDGVVIGANNLTLDLNGHTID